jgi:hypothetical protein
MCKVNVAKHRLHVQSHRDGAMKLVEAGIKNCQLCQVPVFDVWQLPTAQTAEAGEDVTTSFSAK